MMEFNEEAVGFLMNSKSLQIFMEDFNALCLPVSTTPHHF
jgi:hypothetical protein